MKDYWVIFAVFLCCGKCVAAAQNRHVTSPTAAFECKLTMRPEGTGEFVTLKNNKTGKETRLLTTDRWAEVIWSPKDEWFAVIDHWDGQSSTLFVYEIAVGNSGEKVRVSKEYESPSSGAIGTEWSLIEWSVKTGTVRIKRTNVIKDALTIAKHGVEETYVVPIE